MFYIRPSAPRAERSEQMMYYVNLEIAEVGLGTLVSLLLRT